MVIMLLSLWLILLILAVALLFVGPAMRRKLSPVRVLLGLMGAIIVVVLAFLVVGAESTSLDVEVPQGVSQQELEEVIQSATEHHNLQEILVAARATDYVSAKEVKSWFRVGWAEAKSGWFSAHLITGITWRRKARAAPRIGEALRNDMKRRLRAISQQRGTNAAGRRKQPD